MDPHVMLRNRLLDYDHTPRRPRRLAALLFLVGIVIILVAVVVVLVFYHLGWLQRGALPP